MAQDKLVEKQRRTQEPDQVAAAIRTAAASKVPGALKDLISGYQPLDIAFAMRELDSEERERVFGLLEIAPAGVVLEEVDDEITVDLTEATEEGQLAQIIDAMPPDAGTDVVSQLDEEKAHRILQHIPEEESEELRELMQFGPDTAGGLMTPEVVYAPPDVVPAEVIAHIRNQKVPPENLTYVYVVDEDTRRLLGVVDMPELITAPLDRPLAQSMVAEVIAVHPDTDRHEVVQLVDKYDLMALPVVDEDNRLLGMVTIDDVIDAIQAEHSEEISHLGATKAEDLATSSSLRVARLRLPWLLICLAGTFLSATVIRLFTSSVLASLIGLAAFIPVINGMSGNSGLQSSTIMVRALALGLISRTGVYKILLRELLTAIVVALVCGLMAALAAGLFLGDIGYMPILGIAMFCAIIWATMLGAVMPLVFDWLNVDPAVASGPLVTTLADTLALLNYFGIALLLMNVVGLG